MSNNKRTRSDTFVISQEDIEKYLTGNSIKQLAKELHRHPSTIRSALLRRGVQLRTMREVTLISNPQKKPRTHLTNDDILLYVSGNSSSKDLARKLGVDASTVIAALRRQGVAIHTYRDATLAHMQRAGGGSITLARKRLMELQDSGEISLYISAGRQKITLGEWREYLTVKAERLRSSVEWKQWRMEVYTRDNYTCQWCGDSSRRSIAPHHIRKRSIYPEKTFDVSNGITLCKDCHELTYGYEERLAPTFELHIQRYHARIE